MTRRGECTTVVNVAAHRLRIGDQRATMLNMADTQVHIPRLFTLAEVAERSGRTIHSIRTLRARQKRGDAVGPRFVMIDGRVFVRDVDLAAWLNGEDDAR
jgi:hypothetical protein